MLIILVLVFSFFVGSKSFYNILDYGAIPHHDIYSAQIANQQAFIKATLLANSSDGERIVKVPKKTFYFMPMEFNNLFNVTFEIQGRMAASKIIKKWPKNGNHYLDFLTIHNSQYITLHGGGKIDGRGYNWWLACILNIKKLIPNQNVRPHLVRLEATKNIVIHDLIMKNSAQYHLKMDRCFDAEVYNLNILVNTTAQINLLKRFSLEGAIPLFPLNTDGIDPSGARMKFYNLTVQNYDDVVVPKPSSGNDPGNNCTQDMLIENATVVLGVGMSIGSVPPNQKCNCVRNITFRNVYQARPLKGIYLKSNPGDRGTGLIENIYYENFTMIKPVWWAIYIGPQQMKEPDGDGPGCMLYPYDPKGECKTQPLVTMRNITLDKVRIHKSLLFPIIIRCDVKNPCTDINFYDVQVDQWRIGNKDKGYVCEYASGQIKNSRPNLDCLAKENVKQNLQQEQQKWSLEEFKMMLEEMEKAALEVGYEEQDDEFDYDFDPYKHMEEE